MILVLQRILLEALLHVLIFPFWWYTKGMLFAAKRCFEIFRYGNEFLVPALWWRNIFVPMFGQVDWQGRLVSFGIRLANGVARTLALLVWLFFATLLFVIWLALPLGVVVLFGLTLFPSP